MSALTDTRRTALARMSDGEWYLGANITPNGNVLGWLAREGYARRASSGFANVCDDWTITQAGVDLLGASQ